MSEENLQNPADISNEVDAASPESEEIKVTVNKATKEFTIKDLTTGKVITLKANVTEEEDEEEDEDSDEDEYEPLSPEAFRDALKRVDDLGLTWSADRALHVKPKQPELEDALYSEDFSKIQAQYPSLPRELTAVVFHALTGKDAPESVVGSDADLEKKIAAVRDFIITIEFRSEFFFKHAIKVPYFESVDWEVVVKTSEKNVKDMPGTAYALLLLTFHNTNPTVGRLDEHQNITVAVDINLVNKLIRTFVDIKTALEDSRYFTESVNELPKREDKDNETNSGNHLQ